MGEVERDYTYDRAGNHYNTFRYYAPECGRFTKQDPIALSSGLNLYQYAPNTIGWSDPLGLEKLTSGYVYRMGSQTNSKLTPRSGKYITTGLSTTIEKPTSGQFQTLDVKTLNDGGLEVIKDGKNHASVRPANDVDYSKLKEWADKEELINHQNTQKLLKIRVGDI